MPSYAHAKLLHELSHVPSLIQDGGHPGAHGAGGDADGGYRIAVAHRTKPWSSEDPSERHATVPPVSIETFTGASSRPPLYSMPVLSAPGRGVMVILSQHDSVSKLVAVRVSSTFATTVHASSLPSVRDNGQARA